ncbi:MAG: DUF4389 domain-containing protein [Actinomycetota bacterium]
MNAALTYPITVHVPVDDEQRNRWLAASGIVFVKLILLLPHIVLLFLFGIAVQFVAWFGYWGIAFTGRMPDLVRRLEIVYLAWTTRAVAWFAGTTDVYPTYGVEQDHPVTVTVEAAPEEQSRVLAVLGILLIRSIAALPHLLILFLMSFGVVLVAWIGYVIVAVTGQMPLGLHEFILNYQRWGARAWGWLVALTDEYPPFTLA